MTPSTGDLEKLTEFQADDLAITIVDDVFSSFSGTTIETGCNVLSKLDAEVSSKLIKYCDHFSKKIDTVKEQGFTLNELTKKGDKLDQGKCGGIAQEARISLFLE